MAHPSQTSSLLKHQTSNSPTASSSILFLFASTLRSVNILGPSSESPFVASIPTTIIRRHVIFHFCCFGHRGLFRLWYDSWGEVLIVGITVTSPSAGTSWAATGLHKVTWTFTKYRLVKCANIVSTLRSWTSVLVVLMTHLQVFLSLALVSSPSIADLVTVSTGQAIFSQILAVGYTFSLR